MGSRFKCCYRSMSNGVVDLSEASGSRAARDIERALRQVGTARAGTQTAMEDMQPIRGVGIIVQQVVGAGDRIIN